MDAAPLIDRLEANVRVLRLMLESVTVAQATWHPAPGRWSMLEVAAHLLDEERDDFGARLRLLVESPGSTWPPIDPQGWVESRGYANRELSSTVTEWAAARRGSVSWLRSLDGVDWSRSYEHPQLGSLRTGDLLASWAAHDALHIRQLAGLEWGWICRLAEPFATAYAGSW
jgi:DinB superfamily